MMPPSFCRLRREFESVQPGDRAQNVYTGALVTVERVSDRSKGEISVLSWVDEAGRRETNFWSKFFVTHGPIEEAEPDE